MKYIYTCMILCLLVGCDEDLSNDITYTCGHNVGMEYISKKEIFYRVYGENITIHRQNDQWCPSINEYKANPSKYTFIMDILPVGTKIKFSKVKKNDLGSHSVVLYYAEILNGKYAGQSVEFKSVFQEFDEYLGL